MIKQILWDWNGTLFDDVSACISVMNRMLEKRGLPRLGGAGEYRELFCFPVVRYYEKLGFDFSQEPFERAAQEYVAAYDRECQACGLYPGARESLETVRSLGIGQHILSASGRESLQKQMEPFCLAPLFDSVMGVEDNLARSKVELGKNFLSAWGGDPRQVLLVGDTEHDFEVAQAVGCPCVLIPAGHQSRRILKKTGAVLAESLQEVCSLALRG